MKKRLWEVDHPYYCQETNYYHADSVVRFRNLAEFLEGFGDSDLDMNLIIRWDWREGEDWGFSDYNGDDNYRNGGLFIHWMGQRKGLYHTSIVEVCRADEPKVVAFLLPRFQNLMLTWEPFGEENPDVQPAEDCP